MSSFAITIERQHSVTYYLPEPPDTKLDPHSLELDLITLPDHILAQLPQHQHPSSSSVTHVERVPQPPPQARPARAAILRFAEHGPDLPRTFAREHAQHYHGIHPNIIQTLLAGPTPGNPPLDPNDPYWSAWYLVLTLARHHDGRTLAHAPNLDLLLIPSNTRDTPPERL